MRPPLRVMAHVDTEHPIEMPTSVDEDVVQAFRADVLMNRSAKALALGARIGVRMTRTSSVRNTSSNGPENFASRSCRRNLIAVSLRGTKMAIHHAATAWYSWISPPRTSCRSIEGASSNGATG